MRAAKIFAQALEREGLLTNVHTITSELFGSLGHTGRGHGSDKAVLLGLEGEDPESVDTDAVDARMAAIRSEERLMILGRHVVLFKEAEHLIFHRKTILPRHPNGMRFTAHGRDETLLLEREFFSVGGGFVVGSEDNGAGATSVAASPVPHPFENAAELLMHCERAGLSVSTLMLQNESALHGEEKVRRELLGRWAVMRACIERGCTREGVLPGGLKVRRRAATLHRQLRTTQGAHGDPLSALDWVSLFAIAVNEENAAGGRVVTAPTNGAAGIIPAVLRYYERFIPGADDDGIVRFLLTAGAIASLYKKNASISGAEVGCQGEVGVACSMAAGALAEVLGGTPAQVENAAEIGMEHNLGLTCDPVGGLVQVPCIERNAMGAVKAIHAARIALLGDGRHFISLDKVIRTMRQTGKDMKTKYKETSRGGLAVNIIEC
jgi:L-serine dehydratase